MGYTALLLLHCQKIKQVPLTFTGFPAPLPLGNFLNDILAVTLPKVLLGVTYNNLPDSSFGKCITLTDVSLPTHNSGELVVRYG